VIGASESRALPRIFARRMASSDALPSTRSNFGTLLANLIVAKTHLSNATKTSLFQAWVFGTMIQA
jgi:hypothetical protein